MRENNNRPMDRAMAAVFCAILLVAVLIILLAAGHLVSKNAKHKDSGQAAENTQSEKSSETIGMETQETEVTETLAQEETEKEEPFTTTPIPNVESLDTTSYGWGQGVQFDEYNRPISAVQYQETYGKYNANFIGENRQVIYLTFDEGYEYGCTERILDTLKEKGVHAVFFVTQPYAEDNPQLVQRMIDEGHTVGNHSVTHPSKGLPSQTMEQQQQEVMGCHQYVLDHFGYTMHLFRYPTGAFSEQSLAIVNNCNYKSVFWSFAYLDYDVNNQPDQTQSLQKLVDRMHPGAIYLLHAESETNTAILGSFIDQAKAAGYSLEAFD